MAGDFGNQNHTRSGRILTWVTADHTPRRGRPTVLDAVIDRAPDGTPIRVLDAIVASLIAGNYFETACALAGVTAEQAYAWLRTAGKLRIRASGRELEDL